MPSKEQPQRDRAYVDLQFYWNRPLCQGKHGDRKVRELVTVSLQSGSREQSDRKCSRAIKTSRSAHADTAPSKAPSPKAP